MNMKTKLNFWIQIGAIALVFGSCKKDDIGTLNIVNFIDTSASTLKNATNIYMGAAVTIGFMKTNPTYAAIAKTQFDGITFGNELKNSSIVSNNGVFNYATADEFLNIATAAGLSVYGHTLAWHSQQAAGYYKSYAGIMLPTPSATELLVNGGFEAGSGSSFANWSAYNGGTSFSSGTGSNVRTGARSLQVVVAASGAQYTVQLASDLMPTTIGTNYLVTWYIKAATSGGSMRLSTGPTAQYQGDQTGIGTSFTQLNYTFTAKDTQTRILFDIGQTANTYWIDDVSVKEMVAAPMGGQVSTKVDQALGNFITQTVTHYKGKIKAWDVINEMFADDGNIRNNNNTVTTPSDVFVWSNYLGRDYGVKAFGYAAAADSAATLFINDYNLESQPAKLDSLIAYVKEIKARGAKVDGIGTQMHISWNSNYARIDAMFQKLAATGLKVRISELDVRVNPDNKAGFLETALFDGYQADTYKYVVQSYRKNVPAAQQFGITIWGIGDLDSWLYNAGSDFPLMFDVNYAKKPAFTAVLQALK